MANTNIVDNKLDTPLPIHTYTGYPLAFNFFYMCDVARPIPLLRHKIQRLGD